MVFMYIHMLNIVQGDGWEISLKFHIVGTPSILKKKVLIIKVTHIIMKTIYIYIFNEIYIYIYSIYKSLDR